LTKRRLRLLDLVQDDSISREDMTEFCFTLRKHANDLAPLMQRHVPTPPARPPARAPFCLRELTPAAWHTIIIWCRLSIIGSDRFGIDDYGDLRLPWNFAA
jgi:hypothetical protein